MAGGVFHFWGIGRCGGFTGRESPVSPPLGAIQAGDLCDTVGLRGQTAAAAAEQESTRRLTENGERQEGEGKFASFVEKRREFGG
jgi:hypothetical protein